MIKKVGIFYHPQQQETYLLAQELKEKLNNYQVWLATPQQEAEIAPHLPGTDLVFSLGGDGTLLRVTRIMLPYQTPILGVNLGWFGFITELTPHQLKEKLSDILAGGGWVEERFLLQAELEGKVYHALNDIVLARGEEIRMIYIKVTIDGEELTTYRTDGVILATATGSTAYNLSTGGPVLYPWSPDFILKPIYAYLASSAALVLPADSEVDLQLPSERAVLSIDGQLNIPVNVGQKVRVKGSPFTAKLLRLNPKSSYYQRLRTKLLSP